jgi:hypothetical protein
MRMMERRRTKREMSRTQRARSLPPLRHLLERKWSL